MSLGFTDIERGTTGKVHYSLSTDSFSIDNSGNKLFFASPLITLEYREILAPVFSGFARASAGPSYFDYAFNTPGGSHEGAKRLGGELACELGLRYARLQIAGEYRLLTRPASFDFSGLSLTLTYVLVRF